LFVPIFSQEKGMNLQLPESYPALLDAIKARIRAAQIKTVLAANAELIQLYWSIGCDIVEKQTREGWGAKVINRLADDLQRSFPRMSGFSRTNIYRMRTFYIAWAEASGVPKKPTGERVAGEIVPQGVGRFETSIVPQAVGQLPWGHNVVLIEKLKDRAQRLWYAQAAMENGWSRSVLVLHIESRLHERKGKAVTNFNATLPPPQSDLAQETLKDPYLFDFLSLSEEAHERELEDRLVEHLARFLVELGAGFAFVGRQVHVEVGGEDYYLDLLFYHLKLRCFVVIDLKIGEFKPEYAGKMNFYLSAVDDRIRHADDQPTIGLLLCKEKNKVTVEYALRDMKKPIGVAEWRIRLTRALPKTLKPSLPTVAEIEKELSANSGSRGKKRKP
jgi:predicted nuclease of restriction endonuclease-like (RecB) superfamily